MASKELIQAIAATAELCGAKLSEAAAKMLVADLSHFNEQDVMAALSRVRKSGKRFSLSAITDEMSEVDGRPGVEEAWALVPHSEEASVVWTEEIAKAHGVVYDLLRTDKVAARMAFKETYVRIVAEAREQGIPVKWFPSLGGDVLGRQQALIDAVNKNRLKAEYAIRLLPPDYADGLLALTNNQTMMLPAPDPEAKKRVFLMLENLKQSLIKNQS
jgi:hypothetical protein